MTREHFDTTVLKRDKDGNTVLSTYLDEGEKLVGKREDENLVSDETADEQTTLTTDESNTNTVQGSEPIKDDDKKDETVTDKNDDGSTTGTSSDVNQTNETQTPTQVEQESTSTKKTSTKK